MAVYSYRESKIEQIIRAQQRLRLRFCVVVFIILLAAVSVAIARPEWIFGMHQQARVWVIGALFVFFAGPLGENILHWNNRPASLRQALRRTRIEVSESRVRIEEPGRVRQLDRTEIRRVEETPWGIYLRTRGRYRWMFVSKQIDEFESLKQEIAASGIPLVEATTAPNWEEFAGVLVFTATIFCAIFARSVSVLSLNLVIALAVAIAGFAIVGANPDNLPTMRWARLGIFFPVVMTASMLWMTIRK